MENRFRVNSITFALSRDYVCLPANTFNAKNGNNSHLIIEIEIFR